MRLLRYDIDAARTGALMSATLLCVLAIGGCSNGSTPPAANQQSAPSTATASTPDEPPASTAVLSPYPGPSAAAGVYSTSSGRAAVVGILDVQDVEVNTIKNMQTRVVGDTNATSGPTRAIARIDVPDASAAAVRKLNGKRVVIEGLLSDAAVEGQTPYLSLETIKLAPAP